MYGSLTLQWHSISLPSSAAPLPSISKEARREDTKPHISRLWPWISPRLLPFKSRIQKCYHALDRPRACMNDSPVHDHKAALGGCDRFRHRARVPASTPTHSLCANQSLEQILGTLLWGSHPSRALDHPPWRSPWLSDVLGGKGMGRMFRSRQNFLIHDPSRIPYYLSTSIQT